MRMEFVQVRTPWLAQVEKVNVRGPTRTIWWRPGPRPDLSLTDRCLTPADVGKSGASRLPGYWPSRRCRLLALPSLVYRGLF